MCDVNFFPFVESKDELRHVKLLLQPTRPFVAVVAGAKYDTKIGPLIGIYKKVDKLILGGVMYNTYLCAKYGVKIKGIQVMLRF
jgi:phosphoglycerate kinase